MAPSRKRKSDEMAEPTTPDASSTPAPKKMRISQSQKQALIDNLQLEITERARHLRAHYALQCADLKSRIERRVNRIPVSLRTMTMGELITKHAPTPPSPPKPIVVNKALPAAPTASKLGRKRKSSIVIAADPIQDSSNENEEVKTTVNMAAVPKPRVIKRGGSRTGKAPGAGGVLSPRSHNSRTLPRSPIKATTTTSQVDCQPASPSKPNQISRPLSPLKPASPLKSAAIATTSAITSSMHNILATAKSTATRSKAATRPQTSQRTVSQASNHSAASNVTTTSTGTVVKAATRSMRGRGAAATGAAAKKPTIQAAKAAVQPEKTAPAAKRSKAGTVKKTAATAATTMKKAVTAEPAATGKRILRKRN